MGSPPATSHQPTELTAQQVPNDVALVVLFGSRALGQAGPNSDWDVGIRFEHPPSDPLRLYRLDAELAEAMACSSDAIDVVDLDQAPYLLQRVVAEQGILLFERRPGLFHGTCSRAIRQWADWQRRQEKLSLERQQAPA